MSRNNKKVVLVTGGTGLVGKGIEHFISTGAFCWGSQSEQINCRVSACAVHCHTCTR